MKEFNFSLDLTNKKDPNIALVKGEIGVGFNIRLTHMGNLYPINNDNLIIGVFKKADGKECVIKFKVENASLSRITGELSQQCTNVSGNVNVELQVFSGVSVVKSWTFSFVVQEDIGETNLNSSDEYKGLMEVVNLLKDAKNDIVTKEEYRNKNEVVRELNEKERKKNEINRINSEQKRKDDFDQMVEAGVFESNIADKLTELENNYAPELTDVKTQLAESTTLLNQAIANVTVDSEVITARNSGVKGKTFIVLDERLEELELEHVDSIKPFHFNHASQEYVNIDKFYEPLKNGKIYTTEFYKFDVSPSSTGVKKENNEGLVCEPSTNIVKGRNDYENIGLFKSIDVNAYVDENDDYHVIAIDGDGRFKNDGSMGDVYVMAMPGYQKRYETDTVWGISYSDTMHSGFEILGEAVKPDGTIRPYLLHAKYIAGRNPYENNNLASISGVYAEYDGMSHDGQIDKFKEKGIQYSGKTSHDDYYVQLMFWLKYATLNSDTIIKGCQSYYLQYANLVAETGVKRVVVTNSQANGLLMGSTVSIGDYGVGSINADRQVLQNYNLANRVKILDIVDLLDGNSAVYVDSANIFDTTLTTTITTYPWNSGGCDNVLGQDGSPYNNRSGKEPFIINGIEMMVGGYEVLQNLIIHNNSVDNRTDVYVCYDCTKYSKSSPNVDYALVGQMVTTDEKWKYGSKMLIPQSHPSVILITEAGASSTTGTGDGVYTNPTSSGGYRVWRSLGVLRDGAICGLRCLGAVSGLANAYWSFLGRLSATGRSMG